MPGNVTLVATQPGNPVYSPHFKISGVFPQLRDEATGSAIFEKKTYYNRQALISVRGLVDPKAIVRKD